ncbi:hypothetical protein BD626DRAFT_393229 [Schizophyllum amplum]|uniref:Pre-mRNA-splicing factor CWC24 n=1 Tax=Schizophyllum amplum TaxID=97359 RepID=A0A550CZE1_9AGAR|nr:hypothetical protein BD626DRAFT_393229 [Auriculariopsis ampla]
MSSSEVKVPFFKKGKSRATTTRRQRSASPSTLAGPSGETKVVIPKKKVTGNLLSAGTKRKSSQRDDNDDDYDEEENVREGPDVKYASGRSHKNDALEILAGDEIEEVLAKRRRKEAVDAGEDDIETPQDGKYHGQNAYKSHLQKSKEVPKAMRVGPQRGQSTIRQVTITDYQPDVCKDYKETGFCGFGDTCKFLHDRGTYLAGWQLDKLAENASKQTGDASGSDSDSDDEDVPFACLICRKHYTDPIVTRCGHFFCSACAIKRFAKTPKCLACGTPTGGIFNRADKIIEKVEKKRKDREDRNKESEEEGGGGVEIEGLVEGEDGGNDTD